MTIANVKLKKQPMKAFGTVFITTIVNPFDPLNSSKKKTDIHGRELKYYLDGSLLGQEYVVSVNNNIETNLDYIVKANDIIVACPIIAGGGGKNIFRLVAMIALTVVAPYASSALIGATNAFGGLATGFLGYSVVNAGIVALGGLLINAVLPPEVPELGLNTNKTSNTYTWNGITTNRTIGSPIPILYGTHALGGTVINTRVTYDGVRTNLVTQLALCHGKINPIFSDNIKINGESFDNVVIDIVDEETEEVRPSGSYQYRDGSYDQTIMDEFGYSSYNKAVNKKIAYDAEPYITTTESTSIDTFAVHLSFPKGLVDISNAGDYNDTTVEFSIRYRKVGDISWSKLQHVGLTYITEYKYFGKWYSQRYIVVEDFQDGQYFDRTIDLAKLSSATRVVLGDTTSTEDTFTIENNVIEPFKISCYPKNDDGSMKVLEKGQYEIEVTRLTEDSEEDTLRDELLWSHIEEINTDKINYGGIALLGTILEATEQLSGQEPNFNVVCTRSYLDINGSRKSSTNPAWICYDLLTNQDYGGGISTDNLDYTTFEEWADFCDNVTHELYDTVSSLTYSGHAGLVKKDGKWAIRLEEEFSPEATAFIDNISDDIRAVESFEFNILGTPFTSDRFLSFEKSVNEFGESRIYFFLDSSFVDGGTYHTVTLNTTIKEKTFDDISPLQYNGVIDSLGNVWETAQKIAKIGRGSLVLRGTKYSCIWDAPTVVSQLFNDSNTSELTVSYVDINDIATEIEVQYPDKEIGYEMNQVSVVNTQYNSSQIKPIKSTVEGIGLTSESEAIMYGKYLLANNIFIRRTVSFIADVEAIACMVGDVIAVSNKMSKWGVGGRVTNVDGDTITLSEPISSDGLTNYTLKIKSKLDDSITNYTINSLLVESYTITVEGHSINVGDIFAFGLESQDTLQFRVTNISRDTDLTRKITAVEYNESILNFDDTDDQLTRVKPLAIPKNVIVGFTLTESLAHQQDGTLVPKLVFNWEGSKYSTYEIGILKKLGLAGVYLHPLFECKGNTATYIASDLNVGQSYTFYMRDKHGSARSYIYDYTILGKLSKPTKVSGITHEWTSYGLELSWDKNPDLDIAKYRLIGITATKDEYTVSNSYKTSSLSRLHDHTIKISAIDTSGIESDLTTYTITKDSITSTTTNIKDEVVESSLFEKAFLDNKITLYVNATEPLGADTYDIWIMGKNQLTIADLSSNSSQLLDYTDETDRAFYKWKDLNGIWKLCTALQVSIIKQYLYKIPSSSFEDGNVRIFSDTPYPPYSIGDRWFTIVNGNTLFKECTTQRLIGAYVSTDWTDLGDSSIQVDTNTTTVQTGIKTDDPNYVGFFLNGSPYSYIASDGTAKIGNYSGGSGLYWDNSTLHVRGDIVISDPSSQGIVTTSTLPSYNFYTLGTGLDFNSDILGGTNVPSPLTPPLASGLYLTSTHMGYYKSDYTGGDKWRATINSDGTFFFGSPSETDNYIKWDGSVLAVRGELLAEDITGSKISGVSGVFDASSSETIGSWGFALVGRAETLTNSAGVCGYGDVLGVYGLTEYNGTGSYYGVYGYASHVTSGGTGYGVYGICIDTNGYGVYGTGYYRGTHGVCTGTYGVGVYGQSGTGSTNTYGVFGYSASCIAVYGSSNNTSNEWGFYTVDKAYIGGSTFPFTGSHISFSQDTFSIGDIVSTIKDIPIEINQTYTHVEASKLEKDKRAFGVCSYIKYDILDYFNEQNHFTERYVDENDIEGIKIKDEYLDYVDELLNGGYKTISVNAVGEGMINVCEIGGDIENGDYICSSSISGKGMKQDDDLLHNYTVAKSLTDVVWNNEIVGQNGCFEFDGYKCKMIGCTYHCG